MKTAVAVRNSAKTIGQVIMLTKIMSQYHQLVTHEISF